MSQLPKELYAKIQRREKGKGAEVKLSSKEVKEVLSKGIVGFISAGRNPAIEEDMKLSDEAINERDNKLKADLVARGFVFERVHGKYGEEEDSYVVMVNEVSAAELAFLGKKYNQDSVIHSKAGNNKMIYTTGPNAGKHHPGGGWKPVPGADNYYSELKTKDGAKFKFVLNFDFDKLTKAILKFVLL
jgi:hypothetical protein